MNAIANRKSQRAKKLAEALKANLKRRKGIAKTPPSASCEQVELPAKRKMRQIQEGGATFPPQPLRS